VWYACLTISSITVLTLAALAVRAPRRT